MRTEASVNIAGLTLVLTLFLLGGALSSDLSRKQTGAIDRRALTCPTVDQWMPAHDSGIQTRRVRSTLHLGMVKRDHVRCATEVVSTQPRFVVGILYSQFCTAFLDEACAVAIIHLRTSTIGTYVT